MSFNLQGKVIDYLRQNPEQRFTTREMAQWIFETYTEACREKQSRSTATIIPLDDDVALIRQIAAEIGAHRPSIQKKEPKIRCTEGKPKKYYYTQFTESVEVERAENTSTAGASSEDVVIRELDMYPLLAQFLWSEFQIHSKRIDETRSRNRLGPGGNKWLYPDIVGMEDLSQDWDREVKDCVQQYADKKTKLWSFEVKLLINRSNIREVFFQSVSNSSWANLGYLVAREILGDNTLKEFRILASLHGIGLIKLDTENPSESQILIPATEKSEVDWDTVNRLVRENKDFIAYIKLVRHFYQTGEVPDTGWYATLAES